jgi:predicted N-acetyltransferase YhbS
MKDEKSITEKLRLVENPGLSATAALVKEAFDPIQASAFRKAMRYRPDRERILQAAFVNGQGKVVAYAALLPHELLLDGVKLRCAAWEWVATAGGYRKRGLFGQIHARLLEEARRWRYPLLIVNGIPGYYRQFGYEWAVSIDSVCKMETAKALALPSIRGVRARKARLEDTPRLYELWRRHIAGRAQVYDLRTEEKMELQIRGYTMPKNVETRVFVHDGEIFAYLRTLHLRGQDMLMEAPGLTAATIPAALIILGRLAKKNGKETFAMMLPDSDPLFAAARFHGADTVEPMNRYAQQVRILDVPGLLKKMKAAFNKRLAQSPFADVTVSIPCFISGESYTLEIIGGRFKGVGDKLKKQPNQNLDMSRENLAKMIFGYAPFPKLLVDEPDLSCTPRLQPIVEVLFPPLTPCVNDLDAFSW